METMDIKLLHKLFKECLLKEDELEQKKDVDIKWPIDEDESIVITYMDSYFFFSRKRVEENKEEIDKLIDFIGEDFKCGLHTKELDISIDRNGNTWTKEWKDIFAIVMLREAIQKLPLKNTTPKGKEGPELVVYKIRKTLNAILKEEGIKKERQP